MMIDNYLFVNLQLFLLDNCEGFPLYHHGEIDEVVPDSIARADSYWRIEVPGNGDPADLHNTVHLEDNTLPCVCTTTGK